MYVAFHVRLNTHTHTHIYNIKVSRYPAASREHSSTRLKQSHVAFNVKLNIYIYIYNVRVYGHPVHQEGMLSNKLRQYMASNSKLDS